MSRTALLSRWHRRFGLALCLFAILLATTGIALNHTQDLQLARYTVQWPWLLELYGMPSNTPQQSFAVPGHWLSRWQQHVYFDAHATDLPPVDHLAGAVALPTGMALASQDSVWLLDAQAQVIDRLDRPGGAAIAAVGLAQTQLQLRLTDASQWQANADLTAFEAANATDIEWSEPVVLPAGLVSAIAQQAGGVSLERLLLDLHSGRLFSRLGIWLIDLSGLALLVLAITGLWMVLRRWRRHPHPGRHHS
ncbi:MAG: PepSY domain-containing protein [Steroidobacteraceae bacterium]